MTRSTHVGLSPGAGRRLNVSFLGSQHRFKIRLCGDDILQQVRLAYNSNLDRDRATTLATMAPGAFSCCALDEWSSYWSF
jgi:hypothetical protein